MPAARPSYQYSALLPHNFASQALPSQGVPYGFTNLPQQMAIPRQWTPLNAVSNQVAPQVPQMPIRVPPRPTKTPVIQMDLPQDPKVQVPAKLEKAQLKGLIKSWPTMTAEMKQGLSSCLWAAASRWLLPAAYMVATACCPYGRYCLLPIQWLLPAPCYVPGSRPQVVRASLNHLIGGRQKYRQLAARMAVPSLRDSV